MSDFLRDQSKIRIDPVDGLFDLRVYKDSGDTTVPLCEEMREYILAGRVVVSGNLATVTVVLGDMSDKTAQADFDREMVSRGVDTILWETHKRGRVKTVRREIKIEGDGM